jgi:hypothetical protein
MGDADHLGLQRSISGSLPHDGGGVQEFPHVLALPILMRLQPVLECIQHVVLVNNQQPVALGRSEAVSKHSPLKVDASWWKRRKNIAHGGCTRKAEPLGILLGDCNREKRYEGSGDRGKPAKGICHVVSQTAVQLYKE